MATFPRDGLQLGSIQTLKKIVVTGKSPDVDAMVVFNRSFPSIELDANLSFCKQELRWDSEELECELLVPSEVSVVTKFPLLKRIKLSPKTPMATVAAIYDSKPSLEIESKAVIRFCGQSLTWNQKKVSCGKQLSSLKGVENLRHVETLLLGTSSQRGRRAAAIVDVSAIEKLKKLQTLDLSFRNVIDLKPLTGIISLESLWLLGSSVVDITSLSSLTNLKRLSLNQTKVQILDALKSLVNLKALYLGNTKIKEIGVLSHLISLVELELTNTKIVDIAPLYKLGSLRDLNIRGTRVPRAQVQTLKNENSRIKVNR